VRAIAVVVTLLALISGAEAQTLGELTQKCEQLESFWRSYPPTESRTPFPHQGTAGMCLGYMQAFFGLEDLIGLPDDPHPSSCFQTTERKLGGGPKCRRTLGFCFPRGVLLNQVLAVFLAYARGHAAQWHEAASGHLHTSLMVAFHARINISTSNDSLACARAAAHLLTRDEARRIACHTASPIRTPLGPKPPPSIPDAQSSEADMEAIG
jgi:hypothetical protein